MLEIDFTLNSLLIDSIESPWWILLARTQICARPNHCSVMQAEASRL